MQRMARQLRSQFQGLGGRHLSSYLGAAQRHAIVRERPGLVEHHGVDRGQRLQGLQIAHQNAFTRQGPRC